MKYLAILKDSLYEALDSKVLYVMIGISCVLVLLIASVSFRPVPAQEQVEGFATLMTFLGRMQTTGEEFSVANFQQTNDAAEPWQGNYRFDWIVRLPKEKLPGKDAMPPEVRQKHYDQVTGESTTRIFIEGLSPRFERIDISPRQELVLEGNPDFAKEYRFQVATRGTHIKDRRGWTCEPALFFGAWPLSIFRMSLGRAMEFIVDDLIGTFGAAVTILLSIVITAAFIPNMLRKGTIDLLLAKPIRRATLLTYKYIGGLTFMFLNTAVILVGIWFVLGVRTGLWINGLLLCVFIFTFQFAIFYAVSTSVAVWTRSPIVCILAGVLTWLLLWSVGMGYRVVDNLRPGRTAERARNQLLVDQDQRQTLELPGWVVTTADVIHFALPHYKDLDKLTTRLLRRNLLDEGSQQLEEIEQSVSAINWPESIAMTLAFIGVLLGLSCWRFTVKDY